MNKLTSLTKKALTLVIKGKGAYELGKYYFENPNPITEKLAEERSKICNTCKLKVDEVNDLFKVGGRLGATKEDTIEGFSNKSCDSCGCILSFKLRCPIKPCKKWQEKK